ncbi:MAG: hypothetical protein GX227_03460 [Clostridiaceae bacterium]|nr:hypothetical protein [Clostridiaceae bacterium]
MELDSKFEKLIKGEVQYKSANLGCNLLISRLQRKYDQDSSQEVLNSCIQELKTFFEKYKVISAKDLEEIAKL